MTEKEQKKSSGAGKFFLGAALGAAVGAIASKFIKFDTTDDEEEELDIEVAESKPEPKKPEPKKPAIKSKTKKESTK